MLTLTSSRRVLQSPAVAAHLGRCPECLALRSHLFGTLLPGAPEPAAGCEACQQDLAAYVDMSLDVGARAAAETYPQTWWHLWSCRSCAEVVAKTATLAAAERRGPLSPLPIIRPASGGRRAIGRLAVAPQTLARLIHTHKQLGTAYGGEGELVLDEDESGGYSFQLSVQREPGGGDTILVAVIPPVAGQAIIQVGAVTLTVSFDSQGIAQTTGTPADLFNSEPPAISVVIEAE